MFGKSGNVGLMLDCGYYSVSEIADTLKVSENFINESSSEISKRNDFVLCGEVHYFHKEIQRWIIRCVTEIAAEQQRLRIVVAESKGESSPTPTQIKDDV